MLSSRFLDVLHKFSMSFLCTITKNSSGNDVVIRTVQKPCNYEKHFKNNPGKQKKPEQAENLTDGNFSVYSHRFCLLRPVKWLILSVSPAAMQPRHGGPLRSVALFFMQLACFGDLQDLQRLRIDQEFLSAPLAFHTGVPG